MNSPVIGRLVASAGWLLLSWVVMCLTHETGHLLGGWLAGATLVAYDLAPWRLPYSIHDPDPDPLGTLWAGPLFGMVTPVLVAVPIRRDRVWFVADFCLLANGSYLALGGVWGERWHDTQRLLAAGASPWLIGVTAGIATVIGYLRFRRDWMALWSTSAGPAIRRE